LRNFGGAKVRRVVYRSAERIPEHAHDWPLLSLFVLGGCSNETELGETFIAGPSAVLFRAGAAHRNVIGPLGFEQIEIEFDPAWLGYMPDAPASQWLGGHAAADARALARLCGMDIDEGGFRAALLRFMQSANHATEYQPLDWVAAITRRLRSNATLSVNELAKDVKRHPSWLGTAYRHATGEGLQETAARFRVERAARLLRETDQPYAAIAADAGFCDQSHMNRTFRRVLNRLPSDVRDDRQAFRRVG
jgi:AraC family transcriptional regulator